MEFFEKLGKKATETFNNAGEKANKLAGDTKLKLKINDCKSKINDLYQEIGKKIYEKYVLDGNLDIKEQIQEELTKISEYTDEIENFEKQRLELCDMKMCIKCKSKINKKSKFCPECGTEQPEEVVQEAEILNEEVKEEAENTSCNEQETNNCEENKAEEVVEEIVQEKNNEGDNN